MLTSLLSCRVSPEVHYLWCGNGLLGKRFWIVYFGNCCCWHVAHSIMHASLPHTERHLAASKHFVTSLDRLPFEHIRKIKTMMASQLCLRWMVWCFSFDVTGGETVALIWGVMVVVKDSMQAKLYDWFNKNEAENYEGAQVAVGYSHAPVRNLHYWTALRTPEGLQKRKIFFWGWFEKTNLMLLKTLDFLIWFPFHANSHWKVNDASHSN